MGVGPLGCLWGVARLVLWLHPLPPYTSCYVLGNLRESHLLGGSQVKCIREKVINWAENSNTGDVAVFYPTQVEEVKNIVKMAKVGIT